MTGKDMFAKVPEFLAAYDNILQNGFFESVELDVNGKMLEGKGPYYMSLRVMGCVPCGPKYQAEGCGPMVDPSAVIASCRALAAQRKIRTIKVEVKSEDWPRRNARDDRVTGSKGRRVELFLLVSFKI